MKYLRSYRIYYLIVIVGQHLSRHLNWAVNSIYVEYRCKSSIITLNVAQAIVLNYFESILKLFCLYRQQAILINFPTNLELRKTG